MKHSSAVLLWTRESRVPTAASFCKGRVDALFTQPSCLLAEGVNMRGFLRHPSRDNAGPGIWFVTINCHDKQELFGRVVDGRMQLNSLGQIVRDCWQQVPLHFPHVIPDDFIIMPNHMHPLVRLAAPDIRLQQYRERIERFGGPRGGIAGDHPSLLQSCKHACDPRSCGGTDDRMAVTVLRPSHLGRTNLEGGATLHRGQPERMAGTNLSVDPQTPSGGGCFPPLPYRWNCSGHTR